MIYRVGAGSEPLLLKAFESEPEAWLHASRSLL